MSNNANLAHELVIYARHVNHFNRNFHSKERLPREHDWRPIRFAVRDVIFALIAIRLDEKNNIILVDVCLTENPDDIVGWSGTRIATIFILSEAYKTGSSMGIRFTSNFGKEASIVPGQIYDMAYEYGLKLNHAHEGIITPYEARFLYLLLTDFKTSVINRIVELSLANKITPERICYMVHHGTYTKDEMEQLLFSCEFPEHLLLGKITPEDYLLYQDMILRARGVVLGGMLDRTLRLKEVIGADGKVIDLEETDRKIEVSFDERYFAKVYETQEATPIPWTTNRNLSVPTDTRICVLVRARDWADFEYYYSLDMEAVDAFKSEYNDRPTRFFLLVPRNILDIPEKKRRKYESDLLLKGFTLVVCPESVAMLDKDVMGRFTQAETMRIDTHLTDESSKDLRSLKIWLGFNSTEITLVSVPKNLKVGRLSLSELCSQAIYDEDELRRGVNKHSVRSRYSLVCDRIQFLGHLALLQGKYKIHIWKKDMLDALSNEWKSSPENSRNNRSLPIFWMPNQKRPFNSAFHYDEGKRGHVIIAVQNKHAKIKTVDDQSKLVSVNKLYEAFNNQFVPNWINDFGDLTLDQVLVEQIRQAVSHSLAGHSNGISLSEIPHMVISQSLRQMVYEPRPDGVKGFVNVNIVYTDGSQARPFRFHSLKIRTDAEIQRLRNLAPIPIGMISMRHPEMDTIISHYWFRNIEVSQPGMTSAEIDELCYQITLRKLNDIYRLNTPVHVQFLQTGYQPVLVGFWRAVVEFLMKGQDSPPVLLIYPYILNKETNTYDPYQPWY